MSGSLDALGQRTTDDVLRATDVVDGRELISLSPWDAEWLSHHLINKLPAGPLGATEARRLNRLITILKNLPMQPSLEDVQALVARYRTADRLPDSIVPLLDKLIDTAPANGPGVLGIEAPGEATFAGSATRSRPRRGPRRTLPPRERTQREPASPPPDARTFNVSIDDHDVAAPLALDEQYTLAIDVGPRSAVASDFPEAAFASTGADVLDLTIQLDTADFEIYGPSERQLRVPREGRSHGKARFDVRTIRSGRCQLTASVHLQGNFIAQLGISVSVGANGGGLEVQAIGRQIDNAETLESRDITLIIRPDRDGYSCIRLGSSGYATVLPITVAELSQAADAARAALLQVITIVDDDRYIFQEEVAIPSNSAREALRILANAGARLFQRLFYHPAAGADARGVGDWLHDQVTDPNLELTVQILAERLPIPWSLLYFGDVSEGAQLDWDLFLGMRHIIEQLPFQSMPEPVNKKISSYPRLTVSLNINPTIDRAMQIKIVERHRTHWDQIATRRAGVELVSHMNRSEMLAALADEGNHDKLIYFYCHAKASDANKDPDMAALIMGSTNDVASYATLADLNREITSKATLTARPLVFLNACDSANMSPRFYDGFVPFFLSRGARGVVGTEVKTPALFAVEWAQAVIDRLLDGDAIGEAMLRARRQFLEAHRNPLGLLYAMYCDADTRVAPPLPGASAPS